MGTPLQVKNALTRQEAYAKRVDWFLHSWDIFSGRGYLTRRAGLGQSQNMEQAGESGADGNAIAVLSFEEALRELEGVVRRLESGEASLDDSIELYERGETLRAHCQARLDAAQARIERIVSNSEGKATGTVPFDSGE